MEDTNNNNLHNSEEGKYRIFELFTESIGYLRIVLTPLMIGLVIGAVVYFTDPTTIRLILAIAIAILGLVIGIIWANKHWKGNGTMRFISRINATPDLDNPEKSDKPI